MNADDQVTLMEHDQTWADAFIDEANSVRAALGANVTSIAHIGSTAVPGLLAKPIIDMAIEVRSLGELDASDDAMVAIGYAPKGEYGIAGRRYFQKRMNGRRTHHVHASKQGDVHFVRHLAFRDYLIAHPAHATAYAELKRALVSATGATRESYVRGKSAFIHRVEAAAMRWRT